MTLTYAILATLATYRIVRLITVDRITERLREIAEMRAPMLGYLTTCSWCSAVWVAPVPVVALLLWPGNIVVEAIVVTLAVSAATGLVAAFVDRLDG